MKIIYTSLFLAFSMVLTAQEPTDFQNHKSNEIAGFKLYPNPVYDDIVHLTSNDNASKIVVVFDVFGETVLADRISNKILNISSLVPGVYVLQVTEAKKTITRKLVVK